MSVGFFVAEPPVFLGEPESVGIVLSPMEVRMWEAWLGEENVGDSGFFRLDLEEGLPEPLREMALRYHAQRTFDRLRIRRRNGERALFGENLGGVECTLLARWNPVGGRLLPISEIKRELRCELTKKSHKGIFSVFGFALCVVAILLGFVYFFCGKKWGIWFLPLAFLGAVALSLDLQKKNQEKELLVYLNK